MSPSGGRGTLLSLGFAHPRAPPATGTPPAPPETPNTPNTDGGGEHCLFSQGVKGHECPLSGSWLFVLPLWEPLSAFLALLTQLLITIRVFWEAELLALSQHMETCNVPPIPSKVSPSGAVTLLSARGSDFGDNSEFAALERSNQLPGVSFSLPATLLLWFSVQHLEVAPEAAEGCLRGKRCWNGWEKGEEEEELELEQVDRGVCGQYLVPPGDVAQSFCPHLHEEGTRLGAFSEGLEVQRLLLSPHPPSSKLGGGTAGDTGGTQQGKWDGTGGDNGSIVCSCAAASRV